MVRLKFSITLAYHVMNQPADFVFNMQAAHTERQQVFSESLDITPATPYEALERTQDGIRYLRVQAQPGPFKVVYQASVDLNHSQEHPDSLQEMPVSELPLDVLTYIYPSRYCPSDKFGALANFEFGHLTPGYARVMAIRDWVNKRTGFVTGSSGGTTSALETLLDHVGVCRDFAHLMISICRALNIPARFVSGIDYGADPALGPTDFHAYVEVMLSGQWYLFDPSGVSPIMGLIRLGTGRDAADVAFATVFGNVSSEAPVIDIEAVEDADRKMELPVHGSMALSTAGDSVSAFTSQRVSVS